MSPPCPDCTPAKTALCVLGDGGWGTAMAVLLCRQGHPVRLWGHDPDYLAEMASSRRNPRFLPGVELPAALALEPDADAAMAQAAVLVVAIPTPYLRATLTRLRSAGTVPPAAAVVSLTKGVEQGTLARPSAILSEILDLPAQRVAVLSGPSHAEEVVRELPAGVVLAAVDEELACRLQALFMTPTFRVYRSRDPIGVELGGALKNVIAVAVGICEGLALGDNARAALMTRGLAEMIRFATACGAAEHTLHGLSGMGDLVTTCVSRHGRNRAFGLAVAEGRTRAALQADTLTVAEGVHTCASVWEQAQTLGIDMPITDALYRILYEDAAPRQAVADLMRRAARPE